MKAFDHVGIRNPCHPLPPIQHRAWAKSPCDQIRVCVSEPNKYVQYLGRSNISTWHSVACGKWNCTLMLALLSPVGRRVARRVRSIRTLTLHVIVPLSNYGAIPKSLNIATNEAVCVRSEATVRVRVAGWLPIRPPFWTGLCTERNWKLKIELENRTFLKINIWSSNMVQFCNYLKAVHIIVSK